jgi:hypothetical protein
MAIGHLYKDVGRQAAWPTMAHLIFDSLHMHQVAHVRRSQMSSFDGSHSCAVKRGYTCIKLHVNVGVNVVRDLSF